MPYLDDFWREHLTERYIDHSPFVLASYAQNLPQSARADWRPANGCAGRRSRCLAPRCARCVRHALCHRQCAARRGGALQRRHGGGVVQGGEQLDRARMARSRTAAARVDPGAAARRRACRRRDRALRARSALRPGAAVGDGRPAARPSQLIGRSIAPRKSTACRSAFTPARLSAMRRPVPAGRPIISRTACSRPPPSRTRW